MSALTKVASFVLLVDQKMNAVLGKFHTKLSDRAFDSAEKTYSKNRDKSTLASVHANKLARDRTEAAHRALAKQLKAIAEHRDAGLEAADQILEDAANVKLKYEAIGNVTFTKAALHQEAAQARNTIRALLGAS